MIRALERMLKSENLLAEDDRLVVGVSGGADSVALLHLLLELNHQCGWKLHLHVAHLNHKLRGREADDDEAFVKALATRLSVPCTTDQREVSAIAAQTSETIEECGRRERYAFFERVCLQTNSGAVAVAHHADDQAETVLHRILRGTGLRGVAGIPRDRALQPGSSVRLVRPLLHVPRRELLDYLKHRNIAHRDDRSNESTEPTRNWIRIHLLPLIRAELNGRVDTALVRLAQQATDLKSATEDLVERTLESIIIEESDVRISVNADSLSHRTRFLQAAVIAHLCRKMGVREKKLGAAHLNEALTLLANADAQPMMLPGGWCIERNKHELVLSLPKAARPLPTASTPSLLAVPGTTEVSALGVLVTMEIKDRHYPMEMESGAAESQAKIQCIDLEAVQPPLILRTRVKGDRFHPLGAAGPKSLAHFFIDQKIERGIRDKVLIICDRHGPIWIVGHRIDDRVKLTPDTRRVLRMEVRW